MAEQDKSKEASLRKLAQDKSKESIRKLARDWPVEDTSYFDVRITAIERSIPPRSNHEDAKKALKNCKQARKFGFSDKGLFFILKAEAARKDFFLYDRAVKAEKFTRPPKRGLDKLSHVLLEILKRLGKHISSKTVLKELRGIADARLPNATIIEVDEDDDSVLWVSEKGSEKETPFRHIENRLTKPRKEI